MGKELIVDRSLGQTAAFYYSYRVVAHAMLRRCARSEISVDKFPKEEQTGDKVRLIHAKNYGYGGLDTHRESFYWFLSKCAHGQVVCVFMSTDVHRSFPVDIGWTERKAWLAEATPDAYRKVIDIDLSNISAAAEVAHELELRLRPDQVVFSGGKGFHLEWDALMDEAGFDAWRDEVVELEREFKGIDSTIYSGRREWRVPWSLHHSGKVCRPMWEGWYETFTEERQKFDSAVTPEACVHALCGRPSL